MFINPGVLRRDSFAKYSSAFFTISRSNLVLASSRRKRELSASSSLAERFIGVAAPVALPPTDSANRTASTLNSVVYCRFGTDVFLPINFLHSSENQHQSDVRGIQAESASRRPQFRQAGNDMIKKLLLAFAVLFIASCTSVTPQDYSAEMPELDIKEYFNGKVDAWSMIQDDTARSPNACTSK
jgi:hypothetical protein